jgi:hypothetical protein
MDNDNSVNMIRHDNEGINLKTLVPLRQRIPDCRYQPAGVIQPHFPINHLAEQAFALKCAQCHKICAGAGIIVIPQTDGPSMMKIRIE